VERSGRQQVLSCEEKNMDYVRFHVHTSVPYFERWLKKLRPPIELTDGGHLLLKEAHWLDTRRMVVAAAPAGSGDEPDAAPFDLVALDLKPLSHTLLEVRATRLEARYLEAYLELLGRIADRWPRAAPEMLSQPVTADFIRARRERKSRRTGGRGPLNAAELAERAEWVERVEEMSERRDISLTRACQLLGLKYATYRLWKRKIAEAEQQSGA
jgi:hypothetical protein